jgi:hypothetical protein
MDNLRVSKLYIAQFSYSLDDYQQLSVSMELESCRLFLENKRQNNPNIEFVIIAILDE